jgi:ankyrin repeat protein
LLERKANKALMDSDGDTALKHAQNSQHAEIVQLLQD